MDQQCQQLFSLRDQLARLSFFVAFVALQHILLTIPINLQYYHNEIDVSVRKSTLFLSNLSLPHFS